jgi:hypothetical protein
MHRGGSYGAPLLLQSDEIRWNDSKKMSVKLIIFNESSGMYKLKNNKNDEGAVVMRRQTWRADGGDKGTPPGVTALAHSRCASSPSFSSISIRLEAQ